MRIDVRAIVTMLAFGFLPGAVTSGVHAQDKPKASTSRAKPLTFGVLPYLNTRALMTTYGPVADFLEYKLKQPVQLTTATNLETFARRTFAGDYDLALIPPHYGRIAELDHGYTHLLSYRQYNAAVLVTSKGAPLQALDDLRGKSIAIIERSAVLGILAARWLAERGLVENKDYQFVEAGNHSNALHQAASGKTRAAIIWKTILQKSPPELQRDTITFGDVAFSAPSYALIVHKRIAPARRQAIKQALLQFEEAPQGRAFFAGVAHGGYREPNGDDTKLLDRILPEARRILEADR